MPGRSDRERRAPALRPTLPGLPGNEPVEPAGRQAAGRRELGADHRVDRPRPATARRLRLGPLGRRPDRHPVHRRRRRPDAEVARRFDYADESRQGPVPDPEERRTSRAAAARTATGTRSSSTATPASSTSSTRSTRSGRRLEGRLGRDLEPALERAAPGRLDVGGRRRAADLPGPRALRRGRARRDRPCAALHGLADAQGVRLPGAPLRESTSTDPSLPPMGLRVRLKASFDIARYPPQARVVLAGAEDATG